MRVLVTDAEYSLTLAAIRSLGRRRATVFAAARIPNALGFRSRYVAEGVVAPAPETDPDAFTEFVCDFARSRKLDVVLPIGQDAAAALSARLDEVDDLFGLAVPQPGAMEVARSKRRTAALARQLGIPTPAEYSDVSAVKAFPAVAKREVGSGAVRYLNAPDDGASLPAKDWLVQEYVPGTGWGLFALFEHGSERAVFMHRRLRELPVTGGASTAAESVDEPELRELGLRILRDLGWHGVAMVEFRRDARDGTFTLIEINPKFWGSLALPIAAGVDFPWLAACLAAGRPLPPAPTYRVGLKFQWLFDDLVHAAARPRDVPKVLRDLLDPSVRKDVTFRDLRPALAQARSAARLVLRHALRADSRYPHGRPAVARTTGQ